MASIKRVIFFSFIMLLSHTIKSQPLAFPEAEGCGRFSTGGRGGKIIYVTNLNDNGEGSLRSALKKQKEPTTILFSVSGTIFLKSKIEVLHSYITIAGQSAPGEGICIAGSGIEIKGGDNIIIRYLRLRPGDIGGEEIDALTVRNCYNVIVDHCSMSWSTDETCSCYDNTDFTLQWCIVSESLNNSVHHKGEHGYGGIWGGENATFHHNLLAHHNSRNPRLNGSRYHKHPEIEKTELINNVIFNWKMKCIYGGEEGAYSIIGNYFKPGPATSENSSKRILEPWEPYSTYYFNSNFIEGDPTLSSDNYRAIDEEYFLPQEFISNQPVNISNLAPTTSEEAYSLVLEKAGTSLFRDSIDRRIVDEVKNNRYTFGNNGIIDSQKDAGGWPSLKTAPALPDSDSDGMPDEWEIQQKLNPQDPSDGNQITKGNQYTNVEIYMNSLCK
ncbi:MAG TPA: pectate lyase [Prolixibacteraceae bacterium]|mgnify:CR=1 FL=1|nr:pectate lyase [Prolixibacteraceae bacterium]HPS12518.1 pectate lyase [Prolixibacteraceae bacterium]